MTDLSKLSDEKFVARVEGGEVGADELAEIHRRWPPWRDPADELPEPLEDVLVTAETDDPDVADGRVVEMAYRRLDGRWYLADAYDHAVDVVAWMPLPEPAR